MGLFTSSLTGLILMASGANAGRSYDLVCGKITAIKAAHDNSGDLLLRIERQTAVSRSERLYRTKLPLDPAALHDAATVRALSVSRGAFCAQTDDGVYLSRFARSTAKVRISRIPGLSKPTKIKL